MPSKHEALSSNPTAKKRKKERKKNAWNRMEWEIMKLKKN
jgi:hypothetical protein